jgi:signal transduction histidine kinase
VSTTPDVAGPADARRVAAPADPSPDAETSEDPWRARLDRGGRIVLLPTLAVSAVLAVLSERSGYGSPGRLRAALVLAAVTAVWVVLVPTRGRRWGVRGDAGVFVVHVALGAALVALNPWFAIFAWTGFPIADERLPRRYVPWGLAATALVIAAAQAGGYPTDASDWIGYLLVAAVNLGLGLSLYTMFERVVKRNGELNAANTQLAAALAENAGLHAQLVEQAREAGVQDERQRLAGEIHDTLAQGLAGIVTQLEAADGAPDRGTARAHLDRARALARESLTEARRSVRALRPEQLERATLAEALCEHARSWSYAAGVEARVESTGDEQPLPDDVGSALFRVAQEALTNVAKHAEASKVGVTLTYLPDVVVLDVRDDGVGFDAAHPAPQTVGRDDARGGYGLDGMRARLARVGGTLAIETAPGEGVALSATVPLGGGLALPPGTVATDEGTAP